LETTAREKPKAPRLRSRSGPTRGSFGGEEPLTRPAHRVEARLPGGAVRVLSTLRRLQALPSDAVVLPRTLRVDDASPRRSFDEGRAGGVAGWIAQRTPKCLWAASGSHAGAIETHAIGTTILILDTRRLDAGTVPTHGPRSTLVVLHARRHGALAASVAQARCVTRARRRAATRDQREHDEADRSEGETPRGAAHVPANGLGREELSEPCTGPRAIRGA